MDIPYLKSLNAAQLRDICKQHKIPVSGAKNKKELLGRILVRKQMFKSELPNEVFEQIFLVCLYHDIISFKLCCKNFLEMIDNKFWQKKIKIEFKVDYELENSRIEYIELVKEANDLRISKYLEKYENCTCEECTSCKDFCW